MLVKKHGPVSAFSSIGRLGYSPQRIKPTLLPDVLPLLSDVFVDELSHLLQGLLGYFRREIAQ